MNVEYLKDTKPVLLLKGSAVQYCAAFASSTLNVTTEVGRGQLKTLDALITDTNNTTTNSLGKMTIAVGGQNVIEDVGYQNYGILNTLNIRDMQVKTFAQENQTILMTIDNRLSAAETYYQLLTTYTTAAHELFLKNWVTKYLPGYKRKSYQVLRSFGTNSRVILTETMPKNKGNIIGIGISNNLPNAVTQLDLVSTLITVEANGIKIIENIQAGVFHILSGRIYGVLKVYLEPGTVLKITLDVADLTGIGQPPAVVNGVHEFTLYFDNER